MVASDITALFRMGRPVKPLSDYTGTGAAEQFKHNQMRRSNQLGTRGAPRKASTPEWKYYAGFAERSARREAKSLAVELKQLQASYCHPNESVQDMLTRHSVYGGKNGVKQFLPTIAPQQKVMANLSTLVFPKKQGPLPKDSAPLKAPGMANAKGLVQRILAQVPSKLAAELTGKSINTINASGYRQIRVDDPLVDSAWQQRNATDDESLPFEKEAIMEHAQREMSQPSGSSTNIWLLAMPLETLYMSYRRNMGSILKEMLRRNPHDAPIKRGRKTVMARNLALVAAEDVKPTPVEPWGDVITRMTKWALERKAAGLGTKIDPHCIVFNGTSMTFVDADAVDVDDSQDSTPAGSEVDCDSLHSELSEEVDAKPVKKASKTSKPKRQRKFTGKQDAIDQQVRPSKSVSRADQVDVISHYTALLAESRASHSMLRPRSYQTWLSYAKSSKDFRWRSVSIVSDCDVCNSAYMVRKDHEELLELHRNLFKRGAGQTALFIETNSKLNSAAKRVDTVDRHGRQYRNQRSWLRQIEDNLPSRTADQWHVVVYEVPTHTHIHIYTHAHTWK